jgi:isopenicillin N synthase-like dioxygenase
MRIPARDDVYVVNLGDLMQRCTNDVFKSAPHRYVFAARFDLVEKKSDCGSVVFNAPLS